MTASDLLPEAWGGVLNEIFQGYEASKIHSRNKCREGQLTTVQSVTDVTWPTDMDAELRQPSK